jgi:WD40 repeat protein
MFCPAKKEYLVHSLRARPICRSLDMWQHAFSKEIDAVLLAAGDSIRGGNSCFASLEDGESTSSVSDEMFFSVIGSLIYDMLSVDVPVGNVQTFVTVMCSTYQKDRELRDTLKQLVENVCRAVEMSNDSAPQPTPVPRPAASTTVDGSGAVTVMGHEVSPATANTARPQYDLDTVIRRKMSVQDGPLPLTSRRPPSAPISSRANGRDGDKRGGPAELVLSPTAVAAQRWRGASNAAQPVSTAVLLGRQSSPVLSLSVHHGHVACGVADPLIALMDAVPMSLNGSSSITKLEGHTNAVVAVQLQGQTLISGSRDHTLRAWDLRASPKKRSHLFGFLSSSTPPPAHHQTHDMMPASASSSGHSHSGEQIDGAHVSRKSLVMKGHTGAITCLEIGRQLSTDRAIVASGSMDATIRLWDTSKEHSVAVLGSSGGGTRPGVSCLRYLAHFDILVSGSRDESALKSWDMATSKIRCSVPAHRGSIRDIQITGERLVTAANDRVAKVWDARFRDGASFSHALRGHGGPVLCLSLGGPADPNICTGSADGIVRVWDLRYVQKGPRLALAGHQGPVTCLQRDFTRLVSGSEDGSLRVWDMHSGVCLKEARAHQSGVTCMALQDASVYSGSWDGSVRVWDIEVTGR